MGAHDIRWPSSPYKDIGCGVIGVLLSLNQLGIGILLLDLQAWQGVVWWFGVILDLGMAKANMME